MIATTLHASLVAAYCRKLQGSTTGFNRRLLQLAIEFDADEIFNAQDADKDRCVGTLRKSGIVPDAWREEEIDGHHFLIAAEVQCTHPLDAQKWQRYINLFWALDAITGETQLALELVDRNGSVFRVDLSAVAIEFINAPPPKNYHSPPGFLLPELTA